MFSCTCYAKIRFKRFSAPGISRYWKAIKTALRAFCGLLRPVPLHYGTIRRLRYLRRPAAASGAWRLPAPLHRRRRGPIWVWFRSTCKTKGRGFRSPCGAKRRTGIGFPRPLGGLCLLISLLFCKGLF